MRTFMISIAAVAALITFAGMPSSVTALTDAQLSAPPVSAHQQVRVKDAVRTGHPIHAPLFAS
jgi:hypothetical protein